jgi:hypothetical protein
MPNPHRKKKMHKRVVVKTYPAYPTPGELWQAVQVKSDPMLNERILPGTLSGISAVPETISKWIDRNCRFAAGPAPTMGPAPTAGSVPANPAQGETPSTDTAKAQVSDFQKMANDWSTELTNISTDYEHLFADLNRLNWGSAAGRIGRIISRMQGSMTQLADKIDVDPVVQGYKSGELSDEMPMDNQAAGTELTGLDALQKALYDLAESGGPLGFILNYETQLSSGRTPPTVLQPGLNPQIVKKLQDSGYIQFEQNLIALTKKMRSLKNTPFKAILNDAIKTARAMQSLIASLGSTRNVRTIK